MKLITAYSGSSSLAYRLNSDGTKDQLTSPTDVLGTNARPVFLSYRKRIYILNQFSKNMVITEYATFAACGMEAPSSAPTLAVSGIGITGTAICYYTFGHRESGTLIHESNPSPSATLALVNQGRAWTNLLTVSPNPRANVIRGYVGMDGNDARFAWERPLGTTSVTENVATLALGSVLSTQRGVGPKAYVGEIYHDRMWYVDASDKTKIYYSELFEPESVAALNFLTTWDGEFVTGIKRLGDVMLVFCRSCSYVITGWDENDIIIRKISPSIGCISHWSIVDIHGRLWFASQDGVYVYDGSFQYMMDDLPGYWGDSYLANLDAYENCIAADDRIWQTYKLLIPLGGPVRYYVGHYANVEPQLVGGTDQPDWVFDIRDRNDYTIGSLSAGSSGNSRIDEFYTGSCDGFVRKDNVLTNTNDDGDTYNAALTLRTKHQLYNDPGGDITEGKTLHRTWSYVESETSPWTLKLYGGDEFAGDGAVSCTKSIIGSELFVTYTALTISASVADNSYNSSVNAFPLLAVDDVITVSGFTDPANNGAKTVVSSTVSKIIVSGAALVTEAAGASISIAGFPTVHMAKAVHVHTLPERVSGRGFTWKYEVSSPLDFLWRGFGGTYGPGPATRGHL